MTSSFTSAPLLADIIQQRFDVHLSRHTVVQCIVDPTSTSWNGHRVDLDEVSNVAYATRKRSLNLIQSRVERHILVGSPRGDLRIELGTFPFGGSYEPEQRSAYQAMVEALHEHVEPRLRCETIRSIADGEMSRIGSLELTHQSVTNTQTGETIEWRQVPAAQIGGRRVVVRAAVEHDRNSVCAMDMLTPGAVLLPELWAEATIPFT